MIYEGQPNCRASVFADMDEDFPAGRLAADRDTKGEGEGEDKAGASRQLIA